MPCSAMQKFSVRYGIMLLCGWLPPLMLVANGLMGTIPPFAAGAYWLMPRWLASDQVLAGPRFWPPAPATPCAVCECAGISVWINVTLG